MPSDRVQRQIDRLLDEAEQGISARDWALVEARCDAALALDAQNADALSYLAAARQRLQGQAGSEESPSSAAPSPLIAPLPASFANGRYEILGLLGEGSKKVVYRARDTVLKREVAFSLVKIDGLDTPGRERVRREAEMLAQLGAHSNIVTIHDLGDEAGKPFLVSELLPGGDLVQVLRETPGHRLPLERVLDVGTAIGRALTFAHAKGVVHRDIKPGNVWLTADGTPKLGDFGLAAAGEQVRLTQVGMLVGTVAYMPPEQALGGEPTPQADLYALGCLLYELLCGRPPFLSDDPAALIAQHLNAAPVAPSWLSDRCPPALDVLVLQLLAKRPDERPASAAAVVEALARIDPAQRSTSHSEPGTNPLERLAKGAFVGREQELARLRQAFNQAFAGHGSVVMLVGEPGIGKTRTAQALETYAMLRGGRVLWGLSHEASGAPAYWPWMQVGRGWAAATDPAHLLSLLGSAAGELTRLFPDLARLPGVPTVQPLSDPEAAQFALFDAYVQFLRAASARTPLIVAIDDLHWADKPSLQLLQHLARELSTMRVLVVGTYRDTDLSRTHPLAETLAALNRDGAMTRIVLRGLSRAEVAAYVRATAGVELSPPLLERLFDETEGNPFFVSEVVNLLTEEGTLTAERVSDIRVPDGVKEALGRRLDRMSAETAQLLQVAAIIGREFTYDMLTILEERDEELLLRQIEEGVQARVIEELPQAGRYRFTHALMQETLLAELSTTRKVRLHGHVGEALERRWGARAAERASRLALHFGEAATLSARHAKQAVLYGRLAAAQAEATSAWAEAAAQYERCLALVGEADDRLGEDEAALYRTLGRCNRNAGDARVIRGAWRALMRAIDLYRERGDGRGVAEATLEAMGIVAPPARWAALVEQALSLLGSDEPVIESRLLARLLEPVIATLLTPVRIEAAQQRLEALLAQHPDEGVRAALLQVEANKNLFAALSGGESCPLSEVAAMFREAHTRFAAIGRVSEAALSLSFGAGAALSSGDLDTARATAEACIAYCQRYHVRRLEGDAAGFLCSVLLARGELEATSRVEEGNEDVPSLLRWSIARRLSLAGKVDEALAAMQDPSAYGGVPFVVGGHNAVVATLLAQAGRMEHARAAFAEMRRALEEMPLAAEFGGVKVELRVLGYLREWLPALADEPFLAACEALVDALLQSPHAPAFLFLGGSAQGFYATVLRARGRADEAERCLEAGLAWSERERCPVEAGRCLQGLAELALERGDQEVALQQLERAVPLLSDHGATFYLHQVEALLATLAGTRTPPSAAMVPDVEARSEAQGDALPTGSGSASVAPVFISYASGDRVAALALAAALEAQGLQVWIDRRSISGGAGWNTEIVRGIKACAVFVVLGSARAFESPNVQRELSLAVEENRPVLPLLLEAVRPPDEVRYALAGRQWLEVLDQPADAWLPQVLSAVERLR